MPWKGSFRPAKLLFLFMTASLFPLPFAWAAPTAAEVYNGMQKAVWSSAGVVTETLSLPPTESAAKNEAELTPQMKIKYQRNAPKMRVEVASFKGEEGPLFIEDGKERWMVTRVGATLYSKLGEKKREIAFWFPFLLTGDAPRLLGTESLDGKPALLLELTSDGEKKKFWIDPAGYRPLQAEATSGRLQGWRFRFEYHPQGHLNKVIAKDPAGALRAAALRDRPRPATLDDSLFVAAPTRGGLDFVKKGLSALGGGNDRPVTATAGVRGLDEEGTITDGNSDAKAVEEMERRTVSPAEIEAFLKEGKLEKYLEE